MLGLQIIFIWTMFWSTLGILGSLPFTIALYVRFMAKWSWSGVGAEAIAKVVGDTINRMSGFTRLPPIIAVVAWPVSYYRIWTSATKEGDQKLKELVDNQKSEVEG